MPELLKEPFPDDRGPEELKEEFKGEPGVIGQPGTLKRREDDNIQDELESVPPFGVAGEPEPVRNEGVGDWRDSVKAVAGAKPVQTSVLQNWVMKLTQAEQGTLLTAVRGPDDVRKNHPVKEFLRCYRRAILNGAKPCPNGFMSEHAFMSPPYLAALRKQLGSPLGVGSWAEELLWFWETQSDDLPHHFLMYLTHSAEILGFRHPDGDTRRFWLEVYYAVCKSFHMQPETFYQMTERLRDRGCF
jgi:hypothetical protein